MMSGLRSLSGDTSLGRYNKNPRMRVQKAENVNKALEFIRQRGIKLTNIGPEGAVVLNKTWHLSINQQHWVQISWMVI